MNDREALIVKNLSVGFTEKKKTIQILDKVSFSVKEGETVCIVGESGCGKSLTSLSIMGLLPKKGKILNGKILLNNENLVDKSMKEMSRIRGNEISMIFQEPMTSLNPVHRIGKQIAEAVIVHSHVSKKDAMKRALEMLKLVGIPSPERRLYEYPHQLSGGMRQRVMIAMALACNPKILIADEPTTALDVTIQAQILNLMNELKEKMRMSIIFITHDLGVVSEMADKVIVMYAGKVVEKGSVQELFNNPKHPYTQGLIASIPKMDEEQNELPIIKGTVPSPGKMPKGCRFATRCPYARKMCLDDTPPSLVENGHEVSCWMYTDHWGKGDENIEHGRETAATREVT